MRRGLELDTLGGAPVAPNLRPAPRACLPAGLARDGVRLGGRGLGGMGHVRGSEACRTRGWSPSAQQGSTPGHVRILGTLPLIQS